MPRPSRAAGSGKTWRFAVSGDSRNCGDVVMPALAASVRKQHAKFYWHLGDFRHMSHVDEDMEHGPLHLNDAADRGRYQAMAWDDFLKNQVSFFRPLPVFLSIGNHETVLDSHREPFIAKFKSLLDAPTIQAQRLEDDQDDHEVKTYYHWIIGGVDFISLDNASKDQFSQEQVRWFETVLQRDESNPRIRTLVVGMHAALPDSLSFGHSMSNWPQGVRSGRQVYEDLWQAEERDHKNVDVLASHSHFYMEGAYRTGHWKGKVLPGWIIGSAGAVRYPLPARWKEAIEARTNVYGYLLATVNPHGYRPGTIRFTFRQLRRHDVPKRVARRFDAGFADWCFRQNTLCANDRPDCDTALKSH